MTLKIINPMQCAKISCLGFLTLLFVEKQTKIVRQRNQTPFLVTPLSFARLSWKIMTINHIDTSPNFQCCFKIPGWNTTNGPFKCQLSLGVKTSFYTVLYLNK